MTRRKPKPDKRPRWDDPDLQPYIGGELYEPERVNEICQLLVERGNAPLWGEDPTYDLRKKRK